MVEEDWQERQGKEGLGDNGRAVELVGGGGQGKKWMSWWGG